MTPRQGLFGPGQAICRDDALLYVPVAWHRLIHHAYDAIEQAPRVAVGRVTRLGGRLHIECATLPVPARVLWRLAAVARLSAHICEVCACYGRLIPVAEPIHWLVDEPNVLCAYHHWRQLEGDDVERMLAEHASVAARAPSSIHQMLIGDIARVSPSEFRDALEYFEGTEVASDDTGHVYEHRVAWILRHASADQLRACRPEHLAPFFSCEYQPLREAALEALTLIAPRPSFTSERRRRLA